MTDEVFVSKSCQAENSRDCIVIGLAAARKKWQSGITPELSLKAARGERDRLATMAADGKSPAREKQIARTVQAANTTVREFAERYYRALLQ
jgi:hypothetical protein